MLLLISNQSQDKFLSGNLHTGYFWTSNKEKAFCFKSEAEAEAIDFEDTSASEFVSDELTTIVDFETLVSIY